MTELLGSDGFVKAQRYSGSYLGDKVFRGFDMSHRHSRSFGSENDFTKNLQKSYLSVRRWLVLVYKKGDDRLGRLGWGLGSVVEGIL